LCFAYNLMTWNHVIAERFQLAFHDVQIRAAHAAGAYTKQNLAGPRRGNRNVADFERARGDAGGTG
jgi:hypothetical protein